MLGRRVDEVDLERTSGSSFEMERGSVSPTTSSASTEVPDDYEPGELNSSEVEWPVPGYSKDGRKLTRSPVNKRLTYPKVKITRRRTHYTRKRNTKLTQKASVVLVPLTSAPSTSAPIAKTSTPKGKLHPLCADSVAEVSQDKRKALVGKGPSVQDSSCGDRGGVITRSQKNKRQEVMKKAEAVVVPRETRATGNAEVITTKGVKGILLPDTAAVVTARPVFPNPKKSLPADDLIKRKILADIAKLGLSSRTKPGNAVGQSQAIHRTDDLKKSTSTFVKDISVNGALMFPRPLPSEVSLPLPLSSSSFNETSIEIFQPMVSTRPKKATVTAMLTYDAPLHTEQETPLNLSLESANNLFPSFEPSTTSKELWMSQNTIKTLAITSGRLSSAAPEATEIGLFSRKVPTVKRSQPSAYTKNKTAKTNRNSNKSPEPGPSVRVVNGISTFMRGREEVVVDAYPKLSVPKQKPKYDDNVPWICSFCHLQPLAQINLPLGLDGLPPHPLAMGDLFGPYVADLPPIHGETSSSSKRETWMHGDCALWAGRLQLVRDKLLHLEETLLNADTEVCTICNRTGATISCCQQKCTEGVHFPCAKWKGWQLKNFMSYCPKHYWNPMYK